MSDTSFPSFAKPTIHGMDSIDENKENFSDQSRIQNIANRVFQRNDVSDGALQEHNLQISLQAAAPHLSLEKVQQIYQHVYQHKDEKFAKARAEKRNIQEGNAQLSLNYTQEGKVHLTTAGRIVDLESGRLVGSLIKESAPHLSAKTIKQIYEHVDQNREKKFQEARTSQKDITEGNANLAITYRQDGTVLILTEGRSINFDTGELVGSHIQAALPFLRKENLKAIYEEIDSHKDERKEQVLKENKEVSIQLPGGVQVTYAKNGKIFIQSQGRTVDFQTGEIIRSDLQKKLKGASLDDIKSVYAQIDHYGASMLQQAKQSGKAVQFTVGQLILSYNSDETISLSLKGRSLNLNTQEITYALSEQAPQLSKEAIKNIYEYISQNKEVFEAARLKESDIFIPRKQSGLEASLQITTAGHVIVYLKNSSIGQGGEKTVKLAADLETGRLFAYFKTEKINESELEVHRALDDENGFVKLVSQVTYTKSGKLDQGALDHPQRHRVLLSYCNQKDLQQSVSKLNVEEKRAVLTNLGLSLYKMHRKGYLHRDLKLDNVFLHKDPRTHQLETFIADFGISCNQQNVQRRAKYCGTPEYFAPEYARAILEGGTPQSLMNATTEKRDIWALGCVFAQVLGISLPWKKARDMGDFLQKTSSVRSDWMQEPAQNSPEYLVWAMLRPDPEKRISSAELAEKVQRLKWV